jgi:TatD DNase family protein
MQFNIHTHVSSGQAIEIVNSTGNQVEFQLFSVGIHPWDSENSRLKLGRLSETLNSKRCIALGEIGLDKLKGPSMEIQLAVFKEQIALSEKLELPVIIHCVRAWNELKQVKKELNPKQIWIFHGFTKTRLYKEVLENGFYISIGTAVFTDEKVQEILLAIPNDRLFLETDNSNSLISAVYQKVSELKKLPLHELEQILENNFKRVFTRWKIGSNEQNL